MPNNKLLQIVYKNASVDDCYSVCVFLAKIVCDMQRIEVMLKIGCICICSKMMSTTRLELVLQTSRTVPQTFLCCWW